MTVLRLRGNCRPLPIATSPLLRNALPDWRLRFVQSALMFMFAAVVVMASYLQMFWQSDSQEDGGKYSAYSQTLPAFRGMILDRHGNLLAGSIMTRTIVADPLQIKRDLVVQALADVLKQDFRQLDRKLARGKPFSLELSSPLTLNARQRLIELNLEGIYPESERILRIEPEALRAEKATLNLGSQPAIMELASLLDMETGKLVGMLEAGLDKGRRGVELRRQVRESRASQIAELGMVGVSQSGDFKRYYPMGTVSAHLVGFTGMGDSGQEGVESAFEKELSGMPGVWKTVRDRKGRLIEDRGVTYATHGQDVRLSLDSRIQYLAFIALQQAVSQHRAKAGSVVVLDAETGEILALANLPTYDPNDRSTLFGDKLSNRSVIYSYEFGSVMKPFTVARGLEKGIIRPDTVLDCSPGSFQVSGKPIPDHRNFRELSVAQILQKSSNIGTARIGMAMSREEMGDNLARLGFGQKPGEGFPVATAGQVHPWQRWQLVDQSRVAYGYGFSASILQLARAYLAFTREDRGLPPLSIVALDQPPEAGKPAFSARTRHEMLDMLESVVSAPGATGGQAKVPGYRVGGKTGTARKLVNGQYELGHYLATFVGIAPMSAPRLIIAVSIDEPSAGRYGGGDVAAPVFAQIAAGALRSLGVTPDMPLQLAAREAVAPVVVETGEIQ
ncbi:MAG: penicillin-binding protein 2 [Zoogloeaceae bacterium]|jgi:cell division protein FtsI (penicillin-binding protein 3)|nr:penicillin-binding protein 2 [Zoogloeaceae bacterium]